jgi:hypothetical protein
MDCDVVLPAYVNATTMPRGDATIDDDKVTALQGCGSVCG